MSTYTDLAERILQSPSAQRVFEMLSPIYGQSYVGLWLMQVIGMQIDEMETWSNEYLLQVTPETATWTIELWEREYNILPQPWMSLAERQKQISNRMIERAPINPHKLQTMIANLTGAEVQIEERIDRNTFGVYIQAYMGEEVEDHIRQIIDTVKPSHLIYDLRVAIILYGYPKYHIGCAVSQYQLFKVNVIK